MELQTYSKFINEALKDDIKTSAGKKRSKRAEHIGIKFLRSNKRTKIAYFEAIDPNGSTLPHEVSILLDEHSNIGKNLSQKERVKLAVESGDLKVYCDCKDFLYGGYKYMADGMGYGIRKEKMFPSIKNPELKGSVCKHVIATLDELSTFTRNIAASFSWKKS